ncbi:MAG: hypothetical protein PF693_19790 [Spirochaetia bacterium]|jgi:hypothetical protein|nr:hypothetical protein [Spirochaetia bacterium]
MSKYFLLLIFLLYGCELFTNYKTITITLPKDAPQWFQHNNEKTGKVIYPGVSGSIESKTIEWNESFNISIEKGSFIPIALYPSGYLKPAGIILTKDLNPYQDLQLNWSEGFLADLLLDLLKKGIPIEHLNITRLEREIQNVCEGDPWSINRELLIDAIIYNSLSVYKIKSGIRMDIILPIEGSWISDNPFYPLSISNLQGEVLLEGIYPGIHRFKNKETNAHLDILIYHDVFEYLLY